jgi:hypothetical protein
MNGDLMLGWMQEFERQTKPADSNQWRQLVYDLHKSHIDEGVINYAWDHKIDCISYPTNATQIFQGLDVCIFGPFKQALDELKYEYEQNAGIGLTYTTMLRLIDGPWKKAFTHANIISAFRKTGFEPIDRSVVRPDQMKNSAQTHVAGDARYNPALKAILPLCRRWKDRDVESDVYANPETIPDPALWPPDLRAEVNEACEGLQDSDMGWVLGSPSDATSHSGVYTEALGRLPSTPESIRRQEREARRAIDRDCDNPDYERGYKLMAEANEGLRRHLAEATRDIDAHNANHVINQGAITQQKRHLRAREERRKGPVQELVGTKGQIWVTGPLMRGAVHDQNKAALDKEAAKRKRQKSRDSKKKHQKALESVKVRRVTWRKEERERRAAQIEEDRQAWMANRNSAQLERDRQAPKNPQNRRKESTPDDLQDPPILSDEEDDDMEDEEEDEDEEEMATGPVMRDSSPEDADVMAEDD